MKLTIELTPETVQELKAWTEEFMMRLQGMQSIQGMCACGQSLKVETGKGSPNGSKPLTVEAFVADTEVSSQEVQAVKVQPEGYTLETVRAKLAELSRGGKREAVSELIYSYGVKRLTEIEPCHYAAVMQKAGEL